MLSLKKALAAYKWGYLLFALLAIGSGLCLCLFPEESMTVAIRLIGFVTLLLFVYRFVAVLAERNRSFRFFWRVISTLLGLFCGGYMLIAPESALLYLFTAFGLLLIIDGAFKLQTAILSKRYDVFAMMILLINAVATIVFGFILLKFPQESLKVNAVLLGIGLIIDGLQNLFSTYFLPMIESRQKKAFEAEFEEIRKKEEKSEEAPDVSDPRN